MKIYTPTKNILQVLFAVVMISIVSSCHRDIEESTVTNTTIPGPSIELQFDGNLTVQVSDLLNNPIDGAKVLVYEEELTTDKYGFVEFVGIPLDKLGTNIRVIKEDYGFGNIRFNPTGLDNNLFVRLIPTTNRSSHNSTDNVSVEINDGKEVRFQAESFELVNGNAYAGEVQVFTKQFDLNDPFLWDYLPGDLTGIDAKGSMKVLEILSGCTIDLFGLNSAQLNLNKTMSIDFSLLDDIVSEKPDEIGIWHFDVMNGLWRKVSTAIYKDGYYQGEVMETGSFLIAKAHNFTEVSGFVVDQNGTGVDNAVVTLELDSYVAFAKSSRNGSYSLKAPRNTELSIKVRGRSCTEILSEDYLVIADQAVQNDDILLDLQDLNDFQVLVECMSEPLPNSKVIIQTPSSFYKIATDAGGQAMISLLEASCKTDFEISILGLDPISDQESAASTVIYNDVTTPIKVDPCALCMFDVFVIQEIIDPCDLLVQLTVNASNGSGQYSFTWEDGSGGSSTTVTELGDFCVVVTDNVTGCQVFECHNVVADPMLEAFANFQEITCEDFGFIDLNVTGGSNNYAYQWIGPAGFSSNEQFIGDILESGTYSYTVSDANSCATNGEVFIENLIFDYDVSIYTNDNDNVICGDEPKILSIECPSCPNIDDAIWFDPNGESQVGASIVADEEGIYIVEYPSLNCSGTDVIQLQKAEFSDPEVMVLCEFGGLVFDILNLEPGFSASLPSYSYESLIEDFIDIDAAYEVFSPYATCFKSYDLQRPHFTGIEVNFQQVSCSNCSDGSIVVDIQENLCFDCTYENFYIYSQGNYIDDLKGLNGELPSGQYYVVVKSLQGCVVSSTQVNL